MSDATTTRRSSRRSSASSSGPNRSLHPHNHPIDVSSWSVEEIIARMDDLGDRMDFVEVEDETIKNIFVSENIMRKVYSDCADNTAPFIS